MLTLADYAAKVVNPQMQALRDQMEREALAAPDEPFAQAAAQEALRIVAEYDELA